METWLLLMAHKFQIPHALYHTIHSQFFLMKVPGVSSIDLVIVSYQVKREVSSLKMNSLHPYTRKLSRPESLQDKNQSKLYRFQVLLSFDGINTRVSRITGILRIITSLESFCLHTAIHLVNYN